MTFIDWMSTWLYRTAVSGAFGATAFAGLLYSFQNALIYPSNIPSGSRTDVPKPDEYHMPYEDITLTSPDKVKVKAYLMLQFQEPASRPTVLFFHANAGNMGHRLPIARVFYHKMKCNVMMLSYRGYGLSEGAANEKGMKLDAQTALDYVLSHKILEQTKVILYGQSIGGAVTINLAATNHQRIHGVVIENTFESLPKLVPTVMPITKYFVPYLLHQIWPSIDSIDRIGTDLPILFLSGLQDTMIPPSHMKALYSRCSSKNKVMETFASGDHNDTCVQPGYFDKIAEFISQKVLQRPGHRKDTFDPEQLEGAEEPIKEEGIGAGSVAPRRIHKAHM